MFLSFHSSQGRDSFIF